MTKRLILAAVIVLVAVLATAKDEGATAYVVWDRGCLVSAILGETAHAETPMKADGTPDMSKLKVKGLWLQLKPNCERIELRPSVSHD